MVGYIGEANAVLVNTHAKPQLVVGILISVSTVCFSYWCIRWPVESYKCLIDTTLMRRYTTFVFHLHRCKLLDKDSAITILSLPPLCELSTRRDSCSSPQTRSLPTHRLFSHKGAHI